MDSENEEKVLSIVYSCNPIVSVSQRISLKFSILGCGYFEIEWTKICGNLNNGLPNLNVFDVIKKPN